MAMLIHCSFGHIYYMVIYWNLWEVNTETSKFMKYGLFYSYFWLFSFSGALAFSYVGLNLKGLTAIEAGMKFVNNKNHEAVNTIVDLYRLNVGQGS